MKWLVLLVLLAGCRLPVDSDKANMTFKAYGFTDAKLGDTVLLECGDDYVRGNHFSAKNAQGVYVEGSICCGYFKGCTLKF